MLEGHLMPQNNETTMTLQKDGAPPCFDTEVCVDLSVVFSNCI